MIARTRSIARSIARSIVRSVALSFVLAACGSGGGGGGSALSSSAAPAPSTAARQVALTDAENTQHCQGRGGIKVFTGIDDNRDGDLDVPDEVDATEYVCNGVAGPQGDVGPQGNPGVAGTDGLATVIIYFELGQTFSLPEDAAPGASPGTINAFTSTNDPVGFLEVPPLNPAFDLDPDTGTITLVDGASLDFETQPEHLLFIAAVAARSPLAYSNVRITITDVDEAPLQDGTAANPYLVDTLAELQSIATGFQNEAVTLSVEEAWAAGVHYRQTADIDASPTATWNDAGTDTSVYEGFLPMGNCGPDDACSGSGTEADDNVPFGGSYDGGGYLIAGLSIDRSTTEGVGLFGATGSGSVLENVALVGVYLRGSTSGALVGYAQGAVRQSFAAGRVDGGTELSDVGGLIGDSTGAVEDCFAAVMTSGRMNIGGMVGILRGSTVRSFALGSVDSNLNNTGGLVGKIEAQGVLSHSFATGEVTGLVSGSLGGSNAGSVSDSYALHTRVLVPNGSAARSYRVGSAGVGTGITLAGLRTLACAAAIFEDDDGNTCDASNEDVFPWDFGTSADLPVINGLVGGLDAEGQRLAVEFSLVNRTLTGTAAVEKTIFAPFILPREAGSTLSYHWALPSTLTTVNRSRVGDVLGITAPAAEYDVHLTIIERDATGTLLAVYADEFSLTVSAP